MGTNAVNKGENLTFCIHCYKDVAFTTTTIDSCSSIEGAEYCYREQIALCSECGNEVYVPEIHDANILALEKAVKEKQSVIPLEKIREIPKKYNIGKRPLSLVLGWGELTFTRYYNGEKPCKQYSEVLERVLEDPKYYRTLLTSNRNAVSETAYNKSLKKVDEIISPGTSNENSSLTNIHYSDSAFVNSCDCSSKKIYVFASYIVSQNKGVTPSYLQKVLYYIQGFYFAFYQTFPFDDVCYSSTDGPIFGSINDICKVSIHNIHISDNEVNLVNKNFKNFEQSVSWLICCNRITLDVGAQTKIGLNPNETAILDSAIRYICCYSEKTLEQILMFENPWLFYPSCKREDSSNKKIIGDYFSSVKKKYNMLTPMDIRTYLSDMATSI